jgi:uncharacterized protein (TIGR00730 family)
VVAEPSPSGDTARVSADRDADAAMDRRILAARDDEIDRHVRMIADEFRMGFEAIAALDRPAVTIFGSARLPETDPWYEAAVRTGGLFARERFAVVTGGGPGLMEAANRGAQEAGGLSVGFNIELPDEQRSNRFLDVSLTFHHFYARKVMFVKAAEGFVVLPGGFGTLDELFEALTLIQTRKVDHFPVILLGRAHWDGLLSWTDRRVLSERLISGDDLSLLSITDDPVEAMQRVVGTYRAHR